jgi:hypothetical protein
MLKWSKYYFWTSTVLLLTYWICILVFGTTTFADALRGFEVLNQYKTGVTWNSMQYPADLITDTVYFVSWWSPGQWLLPYFFVKTIGIDSIQLLQAIIIIPSTIISLVGYQMLFKKLGFEKHTRWLALFCITSNQLFYWQTLMYYGGDLIMLTVFPYFLIFLINNKHINYRLFLSFVLLSIIGLIAKNTFVIVLLCAMLFVIFRKDGKRKQNLRLNFIFVISCLIIIGAFYFLHLKWGETPGGAQDFEGYNGIPNNWIGDLAYSIGSPLGIFTRYTFFIQKIASSFSFINLLQVIPVILMLWYLYYLTRKTISIYQQLIVWFCLPFIGAFCLMFILNQAVSYEMRHFAPVAFVFFPGFIDWMLQSSRKKVMTFSILAFCLMDLAWFGYSLNKIEHDSEFWYTYKVSKADAQNLNKISEWDSKNKNALILIEDYWALNIAARHNKKLVLQKDEKGWKVVSGMELDHPDYCELKFENLKNYNSVLIVSKKNNTEHLEQAFKTLNPILLTSTTDYNYLEITPNATALEQTQLEHTHD